ncbi:hypothetical protein J6590_101609 [Homalodisca vitripennis]|nr:hypothetical protein J6590_101609 [Homalodisca vitripennis]
MSASITAATMYKAHTNSSSGGSGCLHVRIAVLIMRFIIFHHISSFENTCKTNMRSGRSIRSGESATSGPLLSLALINCCQGKGLGHGARRGGPSTPFLAKPMATEQTDNEL